MNGGTPIPRRERLVFISDVATPQQIKFCEALQPYYQAECWFDESPERVRGDFWKIDLGKHCRVLDPVWFRKPGLLEGRYLAPTITKLLDEFAPNILMLGGFSRPGNYLAYRWARRHSVRTIIFTERSRNSRGHLRKWGIPWRFLHWLYGDVDMVMVSAADIVPQFRDEFRFGDKVIEGRYAADLDTYFNHTLRVPKDAYTYLLANRMTEIYNPLGGLAIFAEIHRRYPASRLLMNAAGELGDACRRKIKELHLEDAVEFLTDIPSWNHLQQVYARSDILLLPANFSNGNFTILEAMASGMGLVISEEVLGIGKLIIDGQNGFRCPPTVDAFVERIERYIADPELFEVHAAINRPLVQPLSAQGTAKFFHETVSAFFTPPCSSPLPPSCNDH